MVVANAPELVNKHLKNVKSPTTSTPKRRSIGSQQNSFILENTNDDTAERERRRSAAALRKRASLLPNLNSSFNADANLIIPSTSELKSHFSVCLQMYGENKINVKNVWSLKIIDFFQAVMQNSISNDLLQVGGISLDVGSKIYGIRVDDIYADCMKLASNLARSQVSTAPGEDHEDSDGEPAEGENADAQKKNDAAKKKSKKRRLLKDGVKHTVLRDQSAAVSDIPRVESACFQTRSNAGQSIVDNFFTNKIAMDCCGSKFRLLGVKSKGWNYPAMEDCSIIDSKKYPLSLETCNTVVICPEFVNYDLENWDPDKDTADKTTSQFDELILDDKGLPIAELDGSVHDIFANPQDVEPGDYDTSDEEDVASNMAFRGSVAEICDLRPDGTLPNDYMYRTLNPTEQITNLWAGPSHWKLKHIHSAKSMYSGLNEECKQKKKPLRAAARPLDFHSVVYINMEAKYKQRALAMANREKIRLPECRAASYRDPRLLRSKDTYINSIRRPETVVNNADDVDAAEYDYENPNDSMYCAQQLADDDNDCPLSPHSQVELENNAALAGDNLIQMPDLVPKSNIGYATQAKKMDMKKLKIACWKTLVNDTSDEDIFNKSVQAITFSKSFAALPNYLTERMNSELSSSLAFIAILHLANEQTLKLTQIDKGDFSIAKDTTH